MKAMNTMRLCFDSRSCNEAFARTAVAAFLCGLDPTVEELSDVKTAVSEAVTNCIVHGYRSRIDKVYLTATIGIKPKDTAPWVVIRIRDKGCGIEDVHKAMEPLFTTAPEEERDQKLIQFRYFQNMTQVQTAQRLEMTQVQVSRREKKILLWLRGQLV